jgi:hypothetical protein
MMSTYCKGNYYSASLQKLSLLRSANSFTLVVTGHSETNIAGKCYVFLPALYRNKLSVSCNKETAGAKFLSNMLLM